MLVIMQVSTSAYHLQIFYEPMKPLQLLAAELLEFLKGRIWKPLFEHAGIQKL